MKLIHNGRSLPWRLHKICKFRIDGRKWLAGLKNILMISQPLAHSSSYWTFTKWKALIFHCISFKILLPCMLNYSFLKFIYLFWERQRECNGGRGRERGRISSRLCELTNCVCLGSSLSWVLPVIAWSLLGILSPSLSPPPLLTHVRSLKTDIKKKRLLGRLGGAVG